MASQPDWPPEGLSQSIAAAAARGSSARLGAARRRAGPDSQAFRIADGRFDPFSPMGASLVGGRWNSPGLGVIYACRSFAGAMLECLAHAGIGRVPKTHVWLAIRIGAGATVEQPGDSGSDSGSDGSLPAGWDAADQAASRAFGDAWLRECRSTVLVVPSVVARQESNLLLNPRHAGFSHITAAAPQPVVWDARLFGRG